MTPADAHGPIENAMRWRAPFPDPYQTSASAEALPVLSVRIGTVSPIAAERNDKLEGQFRASGSGKVIAAAEGRAPFAAASVSRAAATIALAASAPVDAPRATTAPAGSMSTPRACPPSVLIPRFTSAPAPLASPYARAACVRATACGKRLPTVYRLERETERDRLLSAGARTAPGAARSRRGCRCSRPEETGRHRD